MPKKPANLLKNLLAKESEQVLIKFDDNNAYITCTNFEMVCRLIEGRYPNYNSVIPQENPFKVTIDRISFLNALKRVSVFSNPASSLVKLHLKDSLITGSAQDIDFLREGLPKWERRNEDTPDKSRYAYSPRIYR